MAKKRSRKKKPFVITLPDDFSEGAILTMQEGSRLDKNALMKALQALQIESKRFNTELLRYHDMEVKYAKISEVLVGMLGPEQIEAAKIAGCEPEIYAIEYIKMIRENQENVFRTQIHTLQDLKRLFEEGPRPEKTWNNLDGLR